MDETRCPHGHLVDEPAECPDLARKQFDEAAAHLALVAELDRMLTLAADTHVVVTGWSCDCGAGSADPRDALAHVDASRRLAALRAGVR